MLEMKTALLLPTLELICTVLCVKAVAPAVTLMGKIGGFWVCLIFGTGNRSQDLVLAR